MPPDLRFVPGMGLEAALSRFAFTLSLLQSPAAVRRVAAEICDGLDNDCDGVLGATNSYELNSSATYGSNAATYAHMSFVVTPHHDVSIDTFEAYVGGSGTTGVALYTRASSNDPWTLVDSQSSTIGGLGWYGGTGLGWQLTGGTEYMMTFGLTGSYNYTLVTTITQPDWGSYDGFSNVAAGELSPATLTANPNPGASIGFRLTTDC